MEELLVKLSEVNQAITRTETNFKKISKANLTAATAKSRLELLDQRWKNCEELHLQLITVVTPSAREKINYFVNQEFLLIEENYLDARDFLVNQIQRLSPERSEKESLNCSPLARSDFLPVKLPQISLPEFSGDYTEWENFRDMFDSLIVQNVSLSNVSRLHYLKASLRGEAAQLLRHVIVSEANFMSTWAMLRTRYDDKRALITAHLQAFVNIAKIANSSSEELRNLRDRTNESLAALKNLDRPTEHWSDLLVFLIVQKFDNATLREWEMEIGSATDFPSYHEVDVFLGKRIRVLEAIQAAKSDTKSKPLKTGVKSHTASHSSKCLLCKKLHSLIDCNKFKALSVEKRKETAARHQCCFNCLIPGHRPYRCVSSLRCSLCSRRHNTLLHMNDSSLPVSHCPKQKTNMLQDDARASNEVTKFRCETPEEGTQAGPDSHCDVAVHVSNSGRPSTARATLLATAYLRLQADNGRMLKCRVLLDQSSECCFVTERVVKLLKPRREKINTTVYGVGGNSIGLAKRLVYLNLISSEKHSSFIPIQALVLLHLTSYVPPPRPNALDTNVLAKFNLADSDPFAAVPIDLILGADVFGSCLLTGLQQNLMGTLTAQSTIFEWILFGSLDSLEANENALAVTHCAALSSKLNDETLQDALRRFWEMEEPPSKNPLTDEEQQCEEHFCSTHQRNKEGRYIVRLPFKTGPPINIGNSFNRAQIVLDKVLLRITRTPHLYKEYSAFLEEYEKLGHMKRVQIAESDGSQIVYMPHHPIVRDGSSTTPLRVVFNASSLTSNQHSLNSLLHVGPKLLTDLVSIVTRWRRHRYVYMADIEKMFRQIQLHPSERDYQRILWRDDDNKLVAYQLTTVTYGMACAPFLANRVLKQLAYDEGSQFPEAKRVLENDVYVNDVLFGANSVSEAKLLRHQITQLMKLGGFNLRKWSANCEELVEDCPSGKHDRALEFSLQEELKLKVLGFLWKPRSDSFHFKVTFTPIERLTKRIVLSLIAKLYDPLGWLAPVIVLAKGIMQELWMRRLDWDDPLPDELQSRWSAFHHSLQTLESLKFPRWTGQLQGLTSCELHGFSDASTKAYAAAIYIRVLDEDLNQARVTLLMAKTKMAPLNPMSIPRLELCGAALLAKTIRSVAEIMSLQDVPIYCHTDSTVVLAWLGKHPANWKPFVANRIALIHESIPHAKWRYVPSRDNSADCASRGLSPPEILCHPTWWQGPQWLAHHSSKWPEQRHGLSPNCDIELRPASSHVASIESKPSFELLVQFSSWHKLLRVTAYCLRFIDALIIKFSPRAVAGKRFDSPMLNAAEIHRAALSLIHLVQSHTFSSELQALRHEQPISAKSPLKKLNPFIDFEGTLRVGGRLENAPINYDEKHPIVLPRHHISELLVANAHLRALHGGLQLTLHTLRQRYWILGARIIAKAIIRRCVTCTRYRAEIPRQLMGTLPDFRATPNRCFLHTGVDYAGPFNTRSAAGRGHKSHKTYIALFVCCATRATHLELVTDYSANSFIAAFHRFASRRGRPAHLYSDNGTNFQGADRELQACLVKLRRDKDLHGRFAVEGTTWHFIPPAAPHFGGLWEAGVKSLKHHLRRIVGTHTLTYEEFFTLLTRIEACLNSRPIAPLSNDCEDFSYLTPGHFLVGAPLTSVPEPSLEHCPENRLSRWQMVQRIAETFWRRWSMEYMHSLQLRQRWFDKRPNLANGDMVLVRQASLPPSRWLLGRIILCHPGKDGLIRVVRIKTATSVLDRPINQLCVLPVKTETANGSAS